MKDSIDDVAKKMAPNLGLTVRAKDNLDSELVAIRWTNDFYKEAINFVSLYGAESVRVELLALDQHRLKYVIEGQDETTINADEFIVVFGGSNLVRYSRADFFDSFTLIKKLN